jgi:TP901 family phage tail tape measure protein
MAEAFPPAVARLVADASGFLEGIGRANGATRDWQAELARADIASRKTGVSAEAAAQRAATAMGRATAATKLADAQLAAAKAAGKLAAGEATADEAMAAATKAAETETVALEAQARAGIAAERAAIANAQAQLTLAREASTAAAAQESAAARTGGSWSRTAAVLSTVGKVGSLALAGFAFESLKMASEFDRQMEMVHTQAGASQKEVDSLKNGVLALGGATGQGPVKLAEALYHVESVGYRGADALAILKMSAEEASISGANLDATTNALTSTMKTFGDTGVKGATKDIGLLNAIVGQGDMRFQDLNMAIQTGILSTGQTFGVSLQSMGAALEYLTDRGEKADVASTRLAMGITLMSAPAKQATKYLSDMGLAGGDVTTAQTAMQQALHASGLTTTKLAGDLRKPDGIYVALKDLTDRMRKGGLTADETATTIAKVFGGARTGKAMMALIENIESVRQKFDATGRQASQFGEDFNATTQTMSFKWHAFLADLQVAAIKFGHFLEPIASGAITGFEALGRGIGVVGRAMMDNLPVVGALVVAYAALNFERIVGRLSDMSLAFEGMRLGALRALDGLRLLGNGSVLLGGLVAGGLVVGIASVIRNLTDMANSADNVKKQFAQMTQGMNTGNMDTLNKKAAELDTQWKNLSSSGSSWSSVLGSLTGGLTGRTAQQLVDLRQATVDATIAIMNQKDAVYGLSAEFGISRDRVGELANEFGVNLADGTVTSTQKFEAMYGSLGTLPDSFKKVESATADTAKAQQVYNDAITQSINLATGQQGALLQFNSDLLNLGKNLNGNRHDLSDNTAAGIQNQQAIIKQANDLSGYIGTLQKSHTPLAQQQLLTMGLTKNFYDQMIQLGYTKDETDALLTKYGLIPPDKTTTFSTPGLPEAINNVEIFGIALSNIHDKTVTLAVNQLVNSTGAASSAVNAALGISNLPANYNQNGSNPLTAGTYGLGKATGGYITGPGTGTSDSIPLMGSNGEFMVNAKQTAKNRPVLEAINSGADFPRFAQGGPVGYAAGGHVTHPRLNAAEKRYLAALNFSQHTTPSTAAFLNTMAHYSGLASKQDTINAYTADRYAKGLTTAADVPRMEAAGQTATSDYQQALAYFNAHQAALVKTFTSKTASGAKKAAARAVYNQLQSNVSHLHDDASAETTLARTMRAQYAGPEASVLNRGRATRDWGYLAVHQGAAAAAPMTAHITVVSQLDGRVLGAAVSSQQLATNLRNGYVTTTPQIGIGGQR